MELGTHNVKGTAYAVAAVVFAGAASAVANASLSATLTGYAAGGFEQVGFNSTLGWDSGTAVTLWSVRAQQHAFSESNGNQFLSWCAEVYQGVAQGSTYTFDVVAPEQAPGGDVAPGPMGAIKAVAARDLFARWINPANGFVNGGMADRDAKSAAFQIVLWEITHENFTANSAQGILSQMSLTTGAFRADIGGETAAWYAAIVQSLGADGFQTVGLEGLTDEFAQDQLRLVAVPAPAALALAGLAGLASGRRRR